MTNYNMTAYDAARNIFEMATATMQLTDNIGGALVMFIVAIMSLFALHNRTSYLNALPISGFLTAIVGVGLWAVNIIDITLITYPIMYLLTGVFLRVLFWDD